MTKIIFLDIDGVLNPFEERYPLQRTDPQFNVHEYVAGFENLNLDIDTVQQLNRVTGLTKAKLVITSTWRIGDEEHFENLKKFMKLCGVRGEIIDRTPFIGLTNNQVVNRGQEIAKWLDKNLGIKRFVIVDDDSDMHPLEKYLVQTDYKHGLTKEAADEMIKRLKRV